MKGGRGLHNGVVILPIFNFIPSSLFGVSLLMHVKWPAVVLVMLKWQVSFVINKKKYLNSRTYEYYNEGDKKRRIMKNTIYRRGPWVDTSPNEKVL